MVALLTVLEIVAHTAVQWPQLAELIEAVAVAVALTQEAKILQV
jgi:hypothetical protein